jgi:uncharacterized protein (TIGR01244 family)
MLDIRRITDDFGVSPQIAADDLVALRQQGFALVINNRPDDEEPGQAPGEAIRAAAERAGLAYRSIPVAGGFSPAQADAMAEALDEAQGPVFAYCRTGTRSTLLWALAQASRGGDPEEITVAAAAAGYDIAPVRAAVEQLAARAAS